MLIPSYRHTWAAELDKAATLAPIDGIELLLVLLQYLLYYYYYPTINRGVIMLDRGEDGFGFYDWQHQHQHICRNNNNHPSSAASYHVNDNNVMSTVETHTINNMNLFRQWLYPHQLILHTYGRSSTPEEGGGRGIIILTSILVVVILM